MWRRIILGALLIIGYWASGAGKVWAADSAVAKVNSNPVNQGDELVYTVEVLTAGEKQFTPDIVLPDLSSLFQVGETFSRSSVNILNGKTHILNAKEVHLIANQTGHFNIPPAKVELINPSTQEHQVQETNSVMVIVNQPTGKAALPTPTPVIDVLRPIKTSAHISLTQWLPFTVAGVILLSLISGYYYLKNRPPTPPPAAPAAPLDPRTPEQRALDEFEKAFALKQKGEINEFYTALSAILRRYMAELFNFKAEEATTREMLAIMEEMKFKPHFLIQYRQYFLECDQVKFANVIPDAQKIDNAYPQAVQLVKESDKIEVPEPEPVMPETESATAPQPAEQP